MIRRMAVIALLAASCASPGAADMTRPEAELALARANNQMDMAVAARGVEQSEQYLKSAAADYLRLVSEIDNGYLMYNLGNCYMRLRDVGEAVFWYRMAERRIPSDGRLRANLRYARSQVRAQIPQPASSAILDTIFFFHFRIPFNFRLGLFLVLWNVFWIYRIAGIYAPAMRRRWLSAMLAASFIVFGASAGWDAYRDIAAVDGVMVGGDVVVRKGASATFDPVLTEPVSPGVEVNVFESRNTFTRIRFANGLEGWAPAASVRAIVHLR